MADLASILTDPDLGGTAFAVSRKTYRTELGEVVLSEDAGYPAMGNIQPASPEDLALFPQEERSGEMILILSRFPFRLGWQDPIGETFTSADEVVWRKNRYRVIRVKDWSPQSGYRKAWAVRQR